MNNLESKLDSSFWLDSLKIALLTNDTDKALSLIENLPDFKEFDDLLSARELLSQLIDLLESNKEKAAIQMNKIRAAKKFINS